MEKVNLIIIIILANCLIAVFNHPMHKEMMELLESKPNREKFKYWHLLMKRPYDINTQEALDRYAIFKQNLKKIKEINASQTKFVLGLGPFTDLTFEEWASNITSDENQIDQINNKNLVSIDKLSQKEDKLDYVNIDYDNYPDYSYLYDPNDYEIETEMCKFYNNVRSMTKIIELTAKLLKLDAKKASAQSLRNCYGRYENNAKNDCVYTPETMSIIHQIIDYGLPTEEDIPWTKSRGECQKQTYKPYYRAERWIMCNEVSPKDYCNPQVARGAIKHGPYLSKTSLNFELQHYKTGILSASDCIQTNWSVIVFHFTKDYILYSPGFGSRFGDNNGFVKVERTDVKSPNYSCGLESNVIQPVEIYLDKQ